MCESDILSSKHKSQPRRRCRVYAYVTSVKGVLILEHPKHPEAGLQIPGGTVEAGELPEVAVVREVIEETTLQQLSAPVLLGRHTFDMREFDMNEEQDAWFFQMHSLKPTRDSWLHEERFPSDSPVATPIPFRLYWANLPYEGKPLIAHHGKYLPNLEVSKR